MTTDDMLDVLGWSTTQGDAALAGAHAFTAGDPVSACPSSWWGSSCQHPWQAGWIATAAQAAAPVGLSDSRRSGKFNAVMLAHGTAAQLGVTVHASLHHND